MDWHAEEASWSDCDFDIFHYNQCRSVVIRINRKPDSDPTFEKDELRDNIEWQDWLDNEPSANFTESGLYLVLCSRASPILEGTDAPVSYISIHRNTWERLTRTFHIHREIRRPISRGVDYFTSYYDTGKGSESKIYFVARMSASLPGDLAVSLTYVPSKDTTFAVIYGCNEDQMVDIERRVKGAKDKTQYPLLMIGLLAELERERLLAEAEELVDDFTLRDDYFNESTKIAADINNEKTQEYVKLCFRSRLLMHHIKAVKHQLSKLVAEIDKFAVEGKMTCRFNKYGTLMKKRILDIIDEYKVKINECKMIVEDTTLATQTAIFSMDMFDWSPKTGGSVVSNYIWVFAVFAIGLTAITFLVWYYTSSFTSRYTKSLETDVSGAQGKLV
ncbi:hypothetical protein F4805DRAFT_217188 [Annulohypoxylon moriforme]|nr:hypothetical protein F4805DRAFT_217188 [Annulohypoxylon moriforme]